MSTKLKQQQQEAPATSGGDVKTTQVVAETNNNNNKPQPPQQQQQLEHQPTITKQHEKNKISAEEQLRQQQQPRIPEVERSSASARMKINDCDKQKLLTEANEPKSGHGGGSSDATNHHEDDPKMTTNVGELERTQEDDGQSSRANIVSGQQQAPASPTGGRDRRHQANGHVAAANVAPAGKQSETDASRDKDQQDRRRRQPLEAAMSRVVATEVPAEPRLTQDTNAAETGTPQQHHRSADDSSKKSSVSSSVAKENASQNNSNSNNNNNNQKTRDNHDTHLNSTTNSNFHLLGRYDPTQADLKETTSDHELQLHVDSEAAPLSYELAHQQQQPLYSYYSGGLKAPHTKRLSYLQSLLFRKWPCLALSICIMSSLVFGILLSGLALYLAHGASDCSELASRLALAAAAADPTPTHVNHHPNHHLPQQHSHQAASLLPTHELLLDTPSEAAANSELTQRHGLAASSSGASPSWSSQNKHNEQSGGFQRLPSAVFPQHYELFIWPHIAEPSFHFNGSVEIELRCQSATDNITLHSLDLDIDAKSLRLLKLDKSRGEQQNATSTSSTSRRVSASAQVAGPKVARLSQDKQLQYAIVHLDGKLEPGQDYLLRMDFAGVLNDDLAGFYKIKYERQNSSETTWIAASQFQATDARRAFPCFDEPLYKATFGIKIRHWKNMTALSNMPIVNSEQSQDGLWITDTFARSQRMSTYLVAFAVTNFESRTAGNITVWTRPGLVHTAEYSLRIADKILRYYEDFFGIAYPLPKMDMIALPDFNAGAMENWGLITYRETAMLYDAATSSVANKQRVAVVVAHELAHQWFGNLVTPKWWDDLWLNEGFASFVEYIGVDHVEPEWRMLDQFPLEEVQNVFKLDGLSSSHQISIPVNNPDEISEIFDHISYAKGASVIRMMSHFLTEPVFKLGLRRYLRALKYKNAEQSDLWWHLTAAQQLITGNSSSGADAKLESINVGQVMNSWTLQTGYPLVTLTRAYQRGTARLDQVRYEPFKLLEQSVGKPAAPLRNKQRWEIPITYTSKEEQNWQPTTRLWMHQNQSGPVEIESRLMPKVKEDEWMVLNLQQVGYYRVNYDEQNWRLLVEQLLKDPNQIGVTNRAQILDDLFEMARSSLVNYELAMESTKYLHLERDYMPWESVLLSFGYIDNMLERTPLYGDWQDYFAQLIEPYYRRYKDFEWTWPPRPPIETKSDLSSASSSTSTSTTATATATATTTKNQTAFGTVDSNDVLDQYNQVNAISWACSTNNQHCIERAKRVFAEWRQSGVNRIVTQLRYNAYCTAIAYGSKEDWDFLWRVYEREQGASERDRILRALGCSRELWILTRYLEWTFSKSKPIRRQDGSFVFRVIAKNNYGRDIAFNFMRERWPIIKEYYGKSSFSLGHLIKSVAASMNTQSELDQLKGFYESIKSDVGTGKRSFQIAIEEVESNVYWRQRHYKNLEQWLQKQKRHA